VKFEGLWIEIVMEVRGGRIVYCMQVMRVGKSLSLGVDVERFVLIGVYTKRGVDGIC
jgi:hypothetical protein